MKLISQSRKNAGRTVVLLGALSILFSLPGASAEITSTGVTKISTVKHRSTSTVKRRSTTRHRVTGRTGRKTPKSSRKRISPYRRRLARLQPSAERIGEIQRALAQAGYLHQEPSGAWDDATRTAMRRYQSDHGCPATGMPEAKSLMKLGLGPHALPGDVDPGVAALRGGDVTSTPPAVSDPATPPPADRKEQ